MPRIRALAFVGLAGFVVGALCARPDIVRAMVGLAGRSHLIVKQQSLMSLGRHAQSADVEDGTGAATLAVDYYTVPSGRVFIVTDVALGLGPAAALPPGTAAVASLHGAVFGLGGSRGAWPIVENFAAPIDLGAPGLAGTYDAAHTQVHLTGGVPIESGAQVAVTITRPPGIDRSVPLLYEVTILGYETEDAP